MCTENYKILKYEIIKCTFVTITGVKLVIILVKIREV